MDDARGIPLWVRMLCRISVKPQYETPGFWSKIKYSKAENLHLACFGALVEARKSSVTMQLELPMRNEIMRSTVI